MRIFDEQNNLLESIDEAKGYLKNDSLFVCHHEAVEAVEEQGHWETIAEYPNGGKDVEWVVDVPGVEAKEAWDEYEDILRFVHFTAKELAEIQIEKEKAALMESRRQLSVEEVTAIFIKIQINTVDIPDQTSLRMMDYYPAFSEIVGQTVKQGYKFTYNDKLYKTKQPNMNIQEHYPPGTGMESLYEKIDLEHTGKEYDPIPYDGNMILESGKYYSQNDVLYLCNRDTETAVYHALADLVGLYVEVVEQKERELEE